MVRRDDSDQIYVVNSAELMCGPVSADAAKRGQWIRNCASNVDSMYRLRPEFTWERVRKTSLRICANPVGDHLRLRESGPQDPPPRPATPLRVERTFGSLMSHKKCIIATTTIQVHRYAQFCNYTTLIILKSMRWTCLRCTTSSFYLGMRDGSLFQIK